MPYRLQGSLREARTTCPAQAGLYKTFADLWTNWRLPMRRSVVSSSIGLHVPHRVLCTPCTLCVRRALTSGHVLDVPPYRPVAQPCQPHSSPADSRMQVDQLQIRFLCYRRDLSGPLPSATSSHGRNRVQSRTHRRASRRKAMRYLWRQDKESAR